MKDKRFLYVYLEVTKPRVWVLLAFTSLVMMISATTRTSTIVPEILLVLGFIAVTFACAGCEAATSYLDRGIDSKMSRTRNRPVPSGRITPAWKALYLGLTLVGIGLAIAASINIISFILLFLGVLNNIVVYTLLTKRLTPWNILLGSFGGAAPALFGWTTVTSSLSLLPVLFALIIIAWTPWHIWTLAYRYKDDYRNAGVPMMPVVVGDKTALYLITLTGIIMVIFSITIASIAELSWWYILPTLLGGVAVILQSLRFLRHPSYADAWRMFKFSGPYLFIVFLGLMLDELL